MSGSSIPRIFRSRLQAFSEWLSQAVQPFHDSPLLDVLRRTGDLGFTAFGGPPVHFQILHRRFVDGLGFGGGSQWLDEQTYQELFGLCQALPGPGSTKMLFCIALFRAGLSGALLAFSIWSLPGALGMYGLSLGVQRMPDRLPPAVYALLSGLNSSTVGIIALAAVQLAEKAITDPLTRILVTFGACAGLCYNALWYFPALIAIGGLATVIWDTRLQRAIANLRVRWRARSSRQDGESIHAPDDETFPSIPLQDRPGTQPSVLSQRKPRVTTTTPPSSSATQPVEEAQGNAHDRRPTSTLTMPHTISVKLGLFLILLFFVSFATLLALRYRLSSPPLALSLLMNMYLAGTIIFGGGPVVIPLLRSYVVDEGWVSPRDFLVGLAIIQAFPGPNFNFAVYLGALALASGGSAINALPVTTHTAGIAFLGGMLGFVGIFVPGIVLAVGVQSVWQRLRQKRAVVSLLRGVNATAVGLVFTAVYRLWEIGLLTAESAQGQSLAKEPWWLVVAAVTYTASSSFKVPPALAILSGAVLGLAWYGAVGR